MTNDESKLRKVLAKGMSGHESHIDFNSAVKDFPRGKRGVKPVGAPHSAWQLLEHMRIAQHDILEFSRDAKHQSPPWPEGYWPATEAPPSDRAWDETVAAFERDAREMDSLVQDLHQEMLKPFAHGQGQTLLRQALLVATHNSYHLGQLVFVKKMLTA